MVEKKCFTETFTTEERKNESRRIMKKYPASAPIIIEPKDEKTIRIDKNKFLVSFELTYGQLMYIVRKKLKIKPQESIFMFCKGTLPSSQDTIHTIYKKYGSSDGFLYFLYAFENVVFVC